MRQRTTQSLEGNTAMAPNAIRIEQTNETRGHYLHEGFTETLEEFDTVGDVFRRCQKEFGRCTSSVYIDKNDGTTERIGWYFEKRERYTDCPVYFLQGTWVSLIRQERFYVPI
jgi:hypothetical protein